MSMPVWGARGSLSCQGPSGMPWQMRNGCYTRYATKLLVQLDVLCIVAAKQQECTSTFLFQYFSIFFLVSFFQMFSKIFRKKFGFGWGVLPPRPPEFWLGGGKAPPDPPPLTGLAGGRPGPPAFFFSPGL